MRHTTNTLRGLLRPAVMLAALGVWPGATELDAQAALGDTVRITTGWSTGVYQLRALRGDTVVVQEHDATFGIPLSHIERIEVGTRHGPERVVYGALTGAGIGAAAGAFLGFGAGQGCDSDAFCFSPAGGAAVGALYLGAVGGIAGLVLSALSPWSWNRIGPEDLAIRGVPSPDGLSLRVSFRPGRPSRRGRSEPAAAPLGRSGTRD